MEFRKRDLKPEEDMRVFAYNLESLPRRAMRGLGEAKLDVLLKRLYIFLFLTFENGERFST